MTYPLGSILLILDYQLPTTVKDKFFIIVGENKDECFTKEKMAGLNIQFQDVLFKEELENLIYSFYQSNISNRYKKIFEQILTEICEWDAYFLVEKKHQWKRRKNCLFNFFSKKKSAISIRKQRSKNFTAYAFSWTLCVPDHYYYMQLV